ncbi:MAG: zinc/manganese transport system permease protein [Candidatus Sumerlaeota bacterium]|nr:zinc/manganese transport system permease protein [Candidatus Sumerlaeota bacterium]
MADLVSFFAEPLGYQFMVRGLLISIMIGISGGILGCVLIQRRMALMGDALAHSLLPGMGIAYLLFGAGMWSLFSGALMAGILTAAGSSLIGRMTRLKEDTAFGTLFIIFFGTGVAIVSLARSRVRIDLMHFLFGNILGISSPDLWLAWGVTTVTLLLFALFYRHIVLETFDPDFYRATGRNAWLVHAGLLLLVVLNLVAALQAMGIVLALGLFLLPAASATLWFRHWGRTLAMSAVLAVLGSALGLFLSFHLSIPSGPAVVGVLGVFFLLSVLVGPQSGLFGGGSRRHT